VYRRRRLAVGSLIAVVAASLIGITVGSSAIADQSRSGNYEAPRAVVVQQGDTLWAIARRIAPSGNIANLVNELVRLNGADLQVGQVVRIP
jgi:nucleoid-associated protein YgaU